ncbi:thioesterase II family protein [Tengunoibacter tsumagoiensis]|uniref:Thioesterase domain-containing protein n=1 Tax=Tengunoibacter tsumagoiensis TaxID=2014871 RepID=A0A402A7A5_9CHLR|nr:thioesterase II family protein [Tengunoibacter tsumagoiensis]GCE14881.1 hypothetical protein KTT_47400 [Tengunoibacter tsumagoiensis]
MTAASSLSPWFQFARPDSQARLRLFCFSYAGGGASVFRKWADQLPPEIELYPIQLPGRESRFGEAPFTQIAPLIQALSQAIRPYLNRPYVFFGHSMGALVSFELARDLRRQRLPLPLHLLVSARRAPHVPDRYPPIHNLPDAEFIDEIQRLEGTPEEVLRNTDLIQLLFPVLRADFSVCETYTYTRDIPLSCPITAFGGLQDHEISEEEVAAWRKQTTGFFRLHMLEGGHFYLHSDRELLIQLIVQSLRPLLGSLSRQFL